MGAEKRQTFFCGFELLLLPSSSSVIFRGSSRAGTVGRVVSRHSRMCEGGKAPGFFLATPGLQRACELANESSCNRSQTKI